MILSDVTDPILKAFNDDENKFHEFIKKLYIEYKKGPAKPMPDPTIPEIDTYLKTEYLAREVVGDTYFGLDKDPMVDVADIVKLYRIDDPKIMDKLYTQEEKDYQLTISDIYADDQNKNKCKITLISKDGNTVSGFTVQGMSRKISAVVNIITFDAKKHMEKDLDLSNDRDIDFLATLWWAGFIAYEGLDMNKLICWD